METFDGPRHGGRAGQRHQVPEAAGALCALGSALCVATQYFGSPIECDFDSSVDDDMAKAWCWVHGSFWIKRDYQTDFDCRVRSFDPSITSEEEAPKTVYYQWVALFLAMQAGERKLSLQLGPPSKKNP